MLFKSYVKNRRKLKVLLLLMLVALIVITLVLLNSSAPPASSLMRDRTLAEKFGRNSLANVQAAAFLKSPQQNGVIVPEKYDEHKIKARLMQQKLQNIKQQPLLSSNEIEDGQINSGQSAELTSAVHIFYQAPVQWYKTKKQAPNAKQTLKEENTIADEGETATSTTPKPVRTLNSPFYPERGLYKNSESVFRQHFESIRNTGVGVLILSYTGKPAELPVHQLILQLAPQYNLSVTFELSVAGNQSLDYLRGHLNNMRQLSKAEAVFKVHSQSRGMQLPLVYISNAYKLSDTAGRSLCRGHPDGLRRTLDAYFVGHIRLKTHADTMRRLCFDGFYSKLPSNGATFASTWKNWSYLKTFALTYKMLFLPTVGPGFAERNKFPRHGDIQRHRSNGRYYGVAWRTAILNHVGFINIASYNNWPDGSQIEEVMPRAGFLDYSPGGKTKYLDLTKHWVNNFFKARREAEIGGHQTCYELLNNTIC